MKRILILTLSLFLAIFFSSCLEIIEQEGKDDSSNEVVTFEQMKDDFWVPGHPYEIKWRSADILKVHIDVYGRKLLTDGSVDQEITKVSTIVEETEDSGSFMWTIPADFVSKYNGLFDKSSFYMVISDPAKIDNERVHVSEEPVTIDLPNVEIVTPNSRTALKAGLTNTIEYKYYGKNVDVRFDLYKNGEYYNTIEKSIVLKEGIEGEITYPVPYDANIGDSYDIKVIDNLTSVSYEKNGDNVPVVPVITVNSLKTSDVSIGEGNTFNVSWTNTGKFDNVDIEIVNGSGYTSTVAENVPNTGSYSWTIPSNMTLNKAKLRIGVAETGKYYTETDISSLSSLSNRGLTIIHAKISIDKLIDENGIELTNYEKQNIKAIANYYVNKIYYKNYSSSATTTRSSSKKKVLGPMRDLIDGGGVGGGTNPTTGPDTTTTSPTTGTSVDSGTGSTSTPNTGDTTNNNPDTAQEYAISGNFSPEELYGFCSLFTKIPGCDLYRDIYETYAPITQEKLGEICGINPDATICQLIIPSKEECSQNPDNERCQLYDNFCFLNNNKKGCEDYEQYCSLNPDEPFCKNDTAEESGIKEFVDKDGNTVVVNEKSDYDLQIMYKRASDDTLRFKIDMDLNGTTHVYYNIWLKSKTPDPVTGEYELIHEELMRTSYVTETKKPKIINHNGPINSETEVEIEGIQFTREKVEITFFYDNVRPQYVHLFDMNHNHAGDIELVMIPWYEISNMKAETIWGFFINKIFLNSLDSINTKMFEKVSDDVYMDDVKKDSYMIYRSKYDSRITTKVYNPISRINWNKNNPSKKIDEKSTKFLYRYFQSDKEILNVDSDLSLNSKNMVTINITRFENGKITDDVKRVPLEMKDDNGNLIECQETTINYAKWFCEMFDDAADYILSCFNMLELDLGNWQQIDPDDNNIFIKVTKLGENSVGKDSYEISYLRFLKDGTAIQMTIMHNTDNKDNEYIVSLVSAEKIQKTDSSGNKSYRIGKIIIEKSMKIDTRKREIALGSPTSLPNQDGTSSWHYGHWSTLDELFGQSTSDQIKALKRWLKDNRTADQVEDIIWGTVDKGWDVLLWFLDKIFDKATGN